METQQFKQIEQVLLSAGDQPNARKMRQLIEKTDQGRMILAFCGHFSAGKSSLINRLSGGEVLPSSPIPTSANVVTLEHGPEGARVWRKDGTSFDVPLADLEKLREYAVDGEAIETIRIQHPTDFLPESVQLMDTPGIDSTDDAHKLATESALYLADLVIYVMDYNHVQSEVNFGFTKTLKDQGKAVWLVVNQIDKHNAFELPFTEYQRSVQASFAAWGIEPDGIFYTSLRVPDHPQNQFEWLRENIGQLFPRKDSLLASSVNQSARHLVEEHVQTLAANQEPERHPYLELLGDLTFFVNREPVEQLKERVGQLREQVGQLKSAADLLRNVMEKEVYSLIDNAILIPFQTTELCGKFLESRRPGFRVGFLFAGSKTGQEKQDRLLELHADFTGKVAANLEWHLKDLLVKIPERFGIRDESYNQAVYDLKIDITPEVLLGWVKEGALSSPEYMYQYAKDIASETKSMFRRAAAEFIEWIAVAAGTVNQEKVNRLRDELADSEKLLSAAEKLEQLDEELEQRRKELLSMLEGAAVTDSRIQESLLTPVVASGVTQTPASVSAAVDSEKVAAAVAAGAMTATAEGMSTAKNDSDSSTFKSALTNVADRLRTASQMIRPIRGLQSIAAHMTERAERLEQNLFTVALFGAFSAGKSSFANALMGDLVLPVSPNPTTATINKILPPNELWEHGSVRVKLKSVADMMDDIKGSLAVFEQQVTVPGTGSAGDSGEEEQVSSVFFFREALQRIDTLNAQQIPPHAKPYFTFLKAAAKGYDEMQSLLGEELRVDMDTFRQYVAQEEKACFVKWIELYYDCPFTRQGMMLIDTPGADSINARHTKVAFEYIKNADAVLFVTYYNHAFSSADREFLIQLGRVKDSFVLDKMFFLVNAADLAADEEELTDVMTHVRKNLIACGISVPRIYPVSSQLALLARLAEKGALPASADRVYRKLTGTDEDNPVPNPREAVSQSGIVGFESDFLSFTIEELTEMAVQSGMAEIRRAAATLTELVHSAKEGDTVRNKRREELREALEKARAAVDSVDTETELRSLEKEIDELSYYVRQRLFLRYFDAFNESFSSSVLKDDGRDSKRQLRNSLHELIRFLAFDLEQEMRATAIRVENQVNRGAERMFTRYVTEIEAHLAGCTFEPYQNITFPTPEFPDGLQGVEDDRFAGALSIYKNAKDFFEKDAKSKMRDEIEKRLQEPVTGYLQEATRILASFYQEALQDVVRQIRQNVLTEMDEYASGMEAALSMQMNIQELETVKQQLEYLL